MNTTNGVEPRSEERAATMKHTGLTRLYSHGKSVGGAFHMGYSEKNMGKKRGH